MNLIKILLVLVFSFGNSWAEDCKNDVNNLTKLIRNIKNKSVACKTFKDKKRKSCNEELTFKYFKLSRTMFYIEQSCDELYYKKALKIKKELK